MALTRLSLLILLISCSPPKVLEKPRTAVTILLDEGRTGQRMHNFAASDAWAGQFVGNWPDEKRNAIADLLFSMDTSRDGHPRGIGLSMWRYNIGAGSAEQGTSSGIRDEWRRAASPVSPAALPHIQAQNWFLTAAKKRGVDQFLAFYNSPPVELTRNGKAFASNGVCNIDPGNHHRFAQAASGALEAIERSAGIRFDFLSPVNEPQWDWSDGGQEGSPYTNAEIAQLIKSFHQEFTLRNRQTKLLVPEAGHLKYLLPDSDKQGRDDQVRAFFDPGSPLYLGNLSTVYPAIAAHSYFSTSPASDAINLRKNAAELVRSKNGLQYWQSEYCILGDNAGEINGSGRDLGMTPALYLGKVIQRDLVYANATAWQWWLAISPYDYKDGLIYIDQNKTDGKYFDSKMLWVLGNFSRFIRPGMTRVEATADDNDVLVTGFKDANSGKLVVVVVNPLAADKTLALKRNGSALPASKQLTTYTTDEQRNLELKRLHGEGLVAPARSVTTIILD